MTEELFISVFVFIVSLIGAKIIRMLSKEVVVIAIEAKGASCIWRQEVQTYDLLF